MKKIAFGITLLCIVGAIWYLERGKVSPTVSEHAGSQPLALAPSASGTMPAATTPIPGTPANTPPSGREFLQSILLRDKRGGYSPAIEIADPTGFVNTDSLKLADLIGKKVILVDFWTYSCINCIRTLPYVTSWYSKYHDKGLEIVGVHTPEFDFEKDITNVRAAVQKYGIKYPVVLDSNYGTWSAYGNRYWPHEYLIDIGGYIVHDQIGEGNYDETEMEIQKLLTERNQASSIASGTVAMPVTAPGEAPAAGSPETYFGSARNEYFANGTPSTDGTQVLAVPADIAPNKLYLSGTWNFMPEYATNKSAGAEIVYRYSSSKVFFVASSDTGVTATILLDGMPVGNRAGSDVKDGKVAIKESRLYNLVQDASPGTHTLELIIDSPGLNAYTFTFG